MDYRKEAYHIRDVLDGNPIPLSSKKVASIKWKHLQTTKITDEEIEKHFKDCGGIALGTGSDVSKFLCIDFDLNKALEHQYFFEAFMEAVPPKLKKKLLCNASASGIGRHIWVKTDYIAKSMHLTRRLSSVPELSSRFISIINAGKDEDQAMSILLKNPYEVVIETKHRNSYAVLTHPRYKRIFGTTIQEITEEETLFLLENALRLDCGYTKPESYKGDITNYRVIRQYNNEATPESVMELILSCGSFVDVGSDYSGNLRALRHGSTAGHSLAVFSDTSMTHVFSYNTIFGETGTYKPFEVYCICNGYNENEAVQKLTENNM